MDNFIPNPADYVMKGAGKPEAQKIEPATVPLDSLTSMPRNELEALATRLLCQCGLVAAMTKEQTAQAMLDVLAETALKPIAIGLNMKADIQNRMNAIDKWLDRERGKAPQAVKLEVKGEVEHYHNIELSAELLKEQITRILKKPPIVIERHTISSNSSLPIDNK